MRRRNVGPVCVYSEQPPGTTLSTAQPQPGVSQSQSLPSQQHERQHERAPLPLLRRPRSESPVSEDRIDTVADAAAEDNPNWILNAGLLAASSSTTFFNTVFGPSDVEVTTKNGRTLPYQNTAREPPSVSGSNDRSNVRQKSIHSMEYVLPNRKVADNLLDRFFTHAYIHWLDRLKFLRWYEGLWTGKHEADDSIGEQINYANLNIIFALVYQTEPEEITEDQDGLAQAHFVRAQKLLQLSLLDLNRLDLLYTLLLLTQWFQSVNNVRRCTSLVGLCILIARNLGFHIPGRLEAFPNQRQREMTRRAWHGCILMDRITAMISGQSLQISQLVAKETPLFNAIDDEFLSVDSVDGRQPPAQPAMPSFFLAFCQLHLILGDVLEHLQSSRQDSSAMIDVNHIIEIDGDLDAFSKALPGHLRTATATQNEPTYTGPIVHLHSRFLHIRILLYRVFFLHAVETMKHSDSTHTKRFADAVIHQGLLTCVRTAQEMLELISSRLLEDDRGPRLVPQWWHTVTYVYTATTVLIAAHIFPAVVEEMTSGSLAASIRQGIQILDHHSRYKESAQRCKTALTVLCERHINPAAVPPKHTPNGSTLPLDPSFPGPDQLDAAGISADFGWDFSDPFDAFHGDGLDSFLFGNNTSGQEINDWL